MIAPKECLGCGRPLEGRQRKWCYEEDACRKWRNRHPDGELRPVAEGPVAYDPELDAADDPYWDLRVDWEMACICRLPKHSPPEKEEQYWRAKAEAQARLQRNGYAYGEVGKGFTQQVSEFAERRVARPSGYQDTGNGRVFG